MAGELAAEWIKIPDGNGNLQKVWVRDSTARRDIAQLQTDVSGKADAATTLAGYGITDAYTKTQVDGMIPSVPSAYTSNPEIDGTASPGSSTAWARGDHVHPHDITKADVSAIPTKTSDLTNDSGFITASAVPDPSSTAPAMDGTAAAGSSDDYARADHVHPSDTSKQDALSTAQLNALSALLNIHTVSGTTNANGDIMLFSNTDTHVIAAWGSYLCMPFVYSSKTYARMLKVAGSGTTYTPMASTSVTVNYIAI